MNYVIFFGGSLTVLVLGVLTLFKDIKSAANRSFFFVCCVIFLWMSSMYFSHLLMATNIDLAVTIVRLANGMGLLGGLSSLVFFYYFPKRSIEISKWYFVAIYSMALVSFIITSFTPLVQESVIVQNGEMVGDVLGPYFIVFLFPFLLFTMLSGVLALAKLKKAKGITKTKLKIVVAGYFTVLLLAGITNAILPVFDIYFLQKESALLVLLFIVPSFYVIFKYRFFDFSYRLLEFLQNFVKLVLLILLTILFHYLSLRIDPQMNMHISLVLSIAISAITVYYTTNYLPRFGSQAHQNYAGSLRRLGLEILSSSNYSTFHKNIETVFVQKLMVSNVEIFAVRDTKQSLEIPVYKRDFFTDQLESIGKDLLVKEEIEYRKLGRKNKSILKKMEELEAEICAPLISDKKLIGFFVIGKKSDNSSYSKEEIEELLKFRLQLEVGFMNILLKLNLQEENNLMKEIINKKTKKLRKQFEEIRDLLQQQADFIAVTAHEFRTPLSIALFQLEDTLYSHNHDPSVLKDMKNVEASLNKLRVLTQKLFEVQQYDFNKVKIDKRKIDISAFIKDIYNDHVPIMHKLDIDFSLQVPADQKIMANFDPDQFRQLFQNLIANAAKFTPKGGKVLLKLEETPKTISISLADNGKGISDKDKKRIFEKFQNEKSSMNMGIGLGLYIAKKIIQLHKGKIWVEDTDGGGATFKVRLSK